MKLKEFLKNTVEEMQDINTRISEKETGDVLAQATIRNLKCYTDSSVLEMFVVAVDAAPRKLEIQVAKENDPDNMLNLKLTFGGE